MKTIEDISRQYAKYKIFPDCYYSSGSPVEAFIRLYPDNYYFRELVEFLKFHSYPPVQRGADLPWWGCNYFSSFPGKRTMIISQDSLSNDAGSIAFWAQLFSVIKNEDDYKYYTSQLTDRNLFRYNSWNKVYNQLYNWKLDLSYCFITDAAKVYKYGSWKDRDFDRQRSKELLLEEIELCKPDLIIILGSAPLTLLNPDLRYADIVDSGKTINISNAKCVVSPFIIGNGPTQLNFKERLATASKLILEALT